MAASQPFSIPMQGGLDKSSNTMELLTKPGVATKLTNFEISTRGGYRRINGFTQLGDGTRPNSSNDIEGLHVYADGVIAAAGTNIYFSQDGDSWLQINKASVAGGGDNYTAFTGRSALTRTSQSKASFATFEGNTVYGEVIITDEGSGVKPFYFKMTGTGDALSSRTYFAKEITVSGTHYPKFCVIHDKHLVVAGAATALNTIFYSGTSDIDDFTSTGSGSIVLDDQVVGLKSFRNELFVFCKNSIYKLQNINDSSTIAVVPVTKNVGCVDGKTIQEFAGDLIFLAPDGFRTIAGTARIGDVELGTVSKMTQLTGIQAPAVTSGFNFAGKEKVYHGDRNGYIYNHDTGSAFNPEGTETDIFAEYQSPDFDYGDFGTLKTLDHVKVSLRPEGATDPTLRVRFDFDTPDRIQPNDVSLETNDPAIFGLSLFGTTSKFGAAESPLIRQPVQGSGHSNFFKIFSEDTNAPYTINGLYINYRPSGRQ